MAAIVPPVNLSKANEMPKEYINEAGDNIKDCFIDYVKPLIVGNAVALKDDGLLD